MTTNQKPVRIQRKREKNWRMPENTVYVGRPTRWGNPWTPVKYWDAGYTGPPAVANQHCVEAYRAWLLGERHWAHGEPQPVPDLSILRGKDLACWCPLDQPCHADVLLELANANPAA
jgi:hypothetical protein